MASAYPDPVVQMLSRYAVGGATRPDSFSGMDPAFRGGLRALISEAPEDIRSNLRIGSGYRSIARQQQLWDASDKTGKMVARPGHSQHNFGTASDLKYLNDAARQYVHANASRYGLAFPMDYEPWHIELAGARQRNRSGAASGGVAPLAADGAAVGGTAAPNSLPKGPATGNEVLDQLRNQATPLGPSRFQYEPSWIENADFSGKAILDDVFNGRSPLRRLAYQGLSKMFGVG